MRNAYASGEALGVTVASVVVVLCIAWLTLVSFVYVATVRTRHECLAQTCRRLMPRLVHHLLEIALLTGAATAPALPASAAPRGAVRDVPVVRTMASSNPQSATRESRPSPPSPAPAPAPARPSRSAGRTHVVQPGDNLWRIARDELTARRGGAPPDELSTARYWQQVVAANRSTLRSGNPSLIYAGELVALPPAE
jgi:hypothetical protein